MAPDQTSGEVDEQFQDCESSLLPETRNGNSKPVSGTRAGTERGGDNKTPPAARCNTGSDVEKEAETLSNSHTAAVNTVDGLDNDGIIDMSSYQDYFLDL